jgi:hypothetical protein
VIRPIAFALAILAPRAAAADSPRTLLLLSSSASDLDPEALADAIRVQVLDLHLAVEIAPEEDPRRSYPERQRAAAERMDESGASMTLFYDRATGDRQAVLYAVHKDANDEAVVAVIRSPGEPGASLYRSIALRVRDLVTDLATIEQPPPERRKWAIAVGYSVLVLPALDPWLHGPMAGVLRTLRPYEAALELSLSLPRSAEPPTGTAELTTLGGRVAGRLLRRVGRVSLGGGARAGAFLLFAEGAADGVQGEIFRAVPTLGVEAIARAPVAGGIDLELGLALELMLIRERFLLARAEAFDLGHLSFGIRLALLGHK